MSGGVHVGATLMPVSPALFSRSVLGAICVLLLLKAMHVVMIQMIRGSIFGAYSIMLLTMKNQLSSTAYAVYYIRSISIGNKRRANWIYFSASIAACWPLSKVIMARLSGGFLMYLNCRISRSFYSCHKLHQASAGY